MVFTHPIFLNELSKDTSRYTISAEPTRNATLVVFGRPPPSGQRDKQNPCSVKSHSRTSDAIYISYRRATRDAQTLSYAPLSAKQPAAEAKLKTRRGAQSRAETETKIENVTTVKLEYRTGTKINSVTEIVIRSSTTIGMRNRPTLGLTAVCIDEDDTFCIYADRKPAFV
ncbi:hypothetical protein EVAR_96237_1 [Eumeta japonica]|uniref:Uncharacterized protein n=1 Tax=Eumeta variegata TaxID=151549 RepID=A0A4C1WK64_EUMVA|nr:hypothetical protein EVAR_96237_1 [Eumeta japonica]